MPAIPLAVLTTILQKNNARWIAKESPFAALSDDEIRAQLGVIVNEGERRAAMQRASTLVSGTFDPAVDWRNRNGRNCVTPVKDQGNCGSCVSFCTVATVESMALIQHNQTLDLSEADAHFCSSHGATCEGWWPSDALNELKGRGVTDEACFPYQLPPADSHGVVHPVCSPCSARVAVKIGSWASTASATERKVWLSNNGPTCAVFEVFDDFSSYASGVYHHVTGGFVGLHCVEVIGYDDAAGCWICKNSWGASPPSPRGRDLATTDFSKSDMENVALKTTRFGVSAR